MPRYPFESAQFHANRSALQEVRIDHHEVSENEENRKTLLDGIRKIVREEIGTFFQNADSEQIGNLSEIRISENIAQEEIQQNDNSENSADSDFDENEDFVDDDFLEM